MSSDPTSQAIQCVLNAYRQHEVLGSHLRSKMTRAANKYAKTGETPKHLVEVEAVLTNPDLCYTHHINGVTFFATTDSVKTMKKSPLYQMAETLGKKELSPAFVEARRRKGQTAEAWGSRVATGRVERLPGHQSTERATVQSKQAAERQKLLAKFDQLRRPSPSS